MANRQPETQTTFLGRKERVEDALELIGIDASAAVENRDAYGPWLIIQGGDHLHPAVAGGIVAQRFTGVQHQVQQHLLQLDGVAVHGRNVFIDAQIDLNVALHKRPARKRHDIAHHFADIDSLKLGLAAQQQRAQTLDDLPGPTVVADDLLEYLAQLVHIERFARNHQLRSLRIAQYGGQRLLQLVRKRAGEFSQKGHARQMRQLLLQLFQFRRGSIVV